MRELEGAKILPIKFPTISEEDICKALRRLSGFCWLRVGDFPLVVSDPTGYVISQLIKPDDLRKYCHRSVVGGALFTYVCIDQLRDTSPDIPLVIRREIADVLLQEVDINGEVFDVEPAGSMNFAEIVRAATLPGQEPLIEDLLRENRFFLETAALQGSRFTTGAITVYDLHKRQWHAETLDGGVFGDIFKGT